MKKPTLIEGIVVAALLSVGAGAAAFIFFGLFPAWIASAALVTGLTLAYLGYVLWRSGTKVGAATILVTAFVAMIAMFFLGAPAIFLAVIAVSIISLSRSLVMYNSFISAAIDFGLTTLSFGAGIWGAFVSGSAVAGIWSFFLAQALFVFIPTSFSTCRLKETAKTSVGGFERAQRAAEQAIGQMIRETRA